MRSRRGSGAWWGKHGLAATPAARCARASSAALKSEETLRAQVGNVATPVETVTPGITAASRFFSATSLPIFSATNSAVVAVGARQDDDDPVVIEPGDDVTGAKQGGDCFAHVPDQWVDHGSAQQFLDSGQPVDLHTQERYGLSVPLRLGKREREHHAQEGGVVQNGRGNELLGGVRPVAGRIRVEWVAGKGRGVVFPLPFRGTMDSFPGPRRPACKEPRAVGSFPL